MGIVFNSILPLHLPRVFDLLVGASLFWVPGDFRIKGFAIYAYGLKTKTSPTYSLLMETQQVVLEVQEGLIDFHIGKISLTD